MKRSSIGGSISGEGTPASHPDNSTIGMTTLRNMSGRQLSGRIESEEN